MDNSMQQLQNQLQQFSREWDEAMVRNDAEEIGRFMSDDWVIIGTEGGMTSKKAFLAFIASGDLLHDRMDTEDPRIVLYGNTGIITSRGTSAGTYKGTPFSYYEWATSVFIHNGEGWRCVLTMLTPV